MKTAGHTGKLQGVGAFVRYGIVFLLVVLLFVRRNYLFRTPSWAQPFGLISRVRHRLARRKGKPS